MYPTNEKENRKERGDRGNSKSRERLGAIIMKESDPGKKKTGFLTVDIAPLRQKKKRKKNAKKKPRGRHSTWTPRSRTTTTEGRYNTNWVRFTGNGFGAKEEPKKGIRRGHCPNPLRRASTNGKR